MKKYIGCALCAVIAFVAVFQAFLVPFLGRFLGVARAFVADVGCGGTIFEKNIVVSAKKTCKRFCHYAILSVTL